MLERSAKGTAGDVPEVVVKKTRFSIVWLIPLVAIGLGGWLIFKSIRDAGTPITVTFATADGLEAGKTKITYKDVQIGLVDAIRVSDDHTHIVLDATVDKHATDYLKASTRFWVVRPRITLQGISGLGTLLSGAYIEIEPGTGAPARSYEGLEKPPAIRVSESGRRFTLEADDLGSVSIGSPIYFRGILAGEVIDYKLGTEAKGVEIEVFIKDPHDKLVKLETQFWNAGGIDLTMGVQGLDVKTASLEALLIGGVAFETPVLAGAGTPVEEGARFTLHKRYGDIEKHYINLRKYIMYFEDSLRGLSVGAPVEIRGIQIGEVTDILVEFDPEGVSFAAPVVMQIEFDRFSQLALADEAVAKERLDLWIQKGLRAQLKSGSLLTGALFVDFVFDPESPVRRVNSSEHEYLEVPTIPSTLETIEKKVTSVLTQLDTFTTKLAELPLDKLIQNATDAAASIDKLASSEDLRDTIRAANELIRDVLPLTHDLRKLVQDVDTDIGKVVEQADATFAELRSVLETSDQTLTLFKRNLDADSPLLAELGKALKEFSAAARSIRVLASYLERHPEALLKGKTDSGGR